MLSVFNSGCNNNFVYGALIAWAKVAFVDGLGTTNVWTFKWRSCMVLARCYEAVRSRRESLNVIPSVVAVAQGRSGTL